MFVLCIAYVCVSVCLDPLMHLDQEFSVNGAIAVAQFFDHLS